MITQKYHRRSIRLKGYDYSSAGVYFITVCIQNRQLFFNDEKIKSIISAIWQKIPTYYKNAQLDKFVIMPNHIHGIINLENNGRGLIYQTHLHQGMINHAPTNWRLMENPTITLGKIIRYFKAKCTKTIHDCGHKYFKWQKNYYEHVVRDENELNRIHQYIIDNPKNWDNDKENPENII